MEEPLLQSQSGSRTTIALIVILCVSIVLIPTLVAYIPVEHSKWILADARNSLRKAKGKEDDEFNRAKNLLQKAEQVHPEIVRSSDYISLYREIHRENFDQLADLIGKLKREYQTRLLLELADEMLDNGRYSNLIELIDKVAPEIKLRDAELNNVYAYASSLAGINLDAAEKAIDHVFDTTEAEDVSAFLDTKAWVYHRLSRNEDALPVMQKAVRVNINSLQNPLAISRWVASRRLESPEASSPPNNSEVNELLLYVNAMGATDPLSEIEPEKLLETLQEISKLNLNPVSSEPIQAEINTQDSIEKGGAASDEATDKKVDAKKNEANTTAPKGSAASAKQSAKQILSLLQAPVVPTIDNPRLKSDANALLNLLAVFRYHRLEIIRALGFNDIADYEYAILEKLGIDDPRELQ